MTPPLIPSPRNDSAESRCRCKASTRPPVGESGHSHSATPPSAERQRVGKGDAMAHAPTRIANRPVWVDLARQDATGSRRFSEQLFGWNVEVNPDPQYGGYGRAKLGGKDAAGISPAQSPDQPSMWSFYIGTEDADMCGQRVQAGGGKVVVPAMDVGDQGRFATFQDPSGAFISVWQPTGMGGFEAQGPNAFGWAELNARGVEKALTFYRDVFGWSLKRTPIPNSS